MSVAKSCWIVTDGAAGNVKQCEALAQALGVSAERLDVRLRRPWLWLAPRLRLGAGRALEGPVAARQQGPYPDLILSSGRRAALASIVLGRRAGRRSFRVHLLDPRIDPRRFDIVICPQHDACRGPNVLNTVGALHDVSAASLQRWRERWGDWLADRPAPRITVLIGGPTRAVSLSACDLNAILDAAAQAAGDRGTLLMTTSRRTPPSVAATLRDRFAGRNVIFADDLQRESGANPYAGFLAWADRLFVTPDSVNMLSEALGTGKPVHCSPPAGGSARFRRFFDQLSADGRLTPLGDEPAPYEPLQETATIAAEVQRRWQERCA